MILQSKISCHKLQYHDCGIIYNVILTTEGVYGLK
jgi:hypothetical protein